MQIHFELWLIKESQRTNRLRLSLIPPADLLNFLSKLKGSSKMLTLAFNVESDESAWNMWNIYIYLNWMNKWMNIAFMYET